MDKRQNESENLAIRPIIVRKRKEHSFPLEKQKNLLFFFKVTFSHARPHTTRVSLANLSPNKLIASASSPSPSFPIVFSVFFRHFCYGRMWGKECREYRGKKKFFFPFLFLHSRVTASKKGKKGCRWWKKKRNCLKNNITFHHFPIILRIKKAKMHRGYTTAFGK